MDVSVVGLVVGLALGALIGAVVAWGILGRRATSIEVARSNALAQVALLQQQLGAAQAEQQQRQDLQAMLHPVQESLKALADRSNQAHDARVKAESAIVEQLNTVKEQYAALGSTTQQIAAALTKGQTRGQWGEMQLEQLLEHSGLLEEVHFSRQDDRAGDAGRQRPDIVIWLPGGGEIAVDAKFPFDAYWQAIGSDDPQQRGELLAKHARDVMARATELSRKGYAKGGASADFVVMFLPFESLLSAALEIDGTILKRTFEQRVVLATPTTMLALLRTVSFGYDRAAMAANAEEIQQQAMEMLNRLGTLVGHVETMRKGIATSVEGFNKFVGSFETQALVQARRIRDLGVQAPKSLEATAPVQEELREIRHPEAS